MLRKNQNVEGIVFLEIPQRQLSFSMKFALDVLSAMKHGN
jgi:hypothetical protein